MGWDRFSKKKGGGIRKISGRVPVRIWEEGGREGGGGGMGDKSEGKTLVFRQILDFLAQLANPLSPSTVREKNERSSLITAEQNIKKTVLMVVKCRGQHFFCNLISDTCSTMAAL